MIAIEQPIGCQYGEAFQADKIFCDFGTATRRMLLGWTAYQLRVLPRHLNPPRVAITLGPVQDRFAVSCKAVLKAGYPEFDFDVKLMAQFVIPVIGLWRKPIWWCRVQVSKFWSEDFSSKVLLAPWRACKIQHEGISQTLLIFCACTAAFS